MVCCVTFECLTNGSPEKIILNISCSFLPLVQLQLLMLRLPPHVEGRDSLVLSSKARSTGSEGP